MKKKTLVTILCMCLLVSASVMATLAWLTDRDSVANTFTVGNVDITVDETDVDEDGQPIPNADRVKENEYHLIPGQTYVKDPRMTVEKGSEESYVRMMMTVTNTDGMAAMIAKAEDNNGDGVVDYADLFDGWDNSKWIYKGFTADAANKTITFEFRYHEKVARDNGIDTVLEPLFESITVPGTVNGAELKALQDGGFRIDVVGHAIQVSTFADEDAAWVAFDKQWEAENK